MAYNTTLNYSSISPIIDFMKSEGITKLIGADDWFLTVEGDFKNPFSTFKDLPNEGNAIKDDGLSKVVFSNTNKILNPHYANYQGEEVPVKEKKIIPKNKLGENDLLAKTITDYIKHVSDFGLENSPLWYRGQSDSAHKLIPNIYRPNVYSTLKRAYQDYCDTHVNKVEKLQLEQFRALSFPYLEYMPNNEQEWLILMQHHGLKTRLLDFSLDPLIALSFALEIEKDKPNDKDAAVWLVTPLRINADYHSIHHMPNFASDSDYEAFKPCYKIAQERVSGKDAGYRAPIAVIGALNNKRIISQSGTFFLFPNMDGSDNFDERCLIKDEYYKKIVIPADSKIPMRLQLRGMGYNRTKLYPMIDSVSLDLEYNFRND